MSNFARLDCYYSVDGVIFSTTGGLTNAESAMNVRGMSDECHRMSDKCSRMHAQLCSPMTFADCFVPFTAFFGPFAVMLLAEWKPAINFVILKYVL